MSAPPITIAEVALMLRAAYDLAARVAEGSETVLEAAREIRALGERVSIERGDGETRLTRPIFKGSSKDQ